MLGDNYLPPLAVYNFPTWPRLRSGLFFLALYTYSLREYGSAGKTDVSHLFYRFQTSCWWCTWIARGAEFQKRWKCGRKKTHTQRFHSIWSLNLSRLRLLFSLQQPLSCRLWNMRTTQRLVEGFLVPVFTAVYCFILLPEKGAIFNRFSASNSGHSVNMASQFTTSLNSYELLIM